VGGPAFLVGHSDGAPVALVTALLRPDLVRRLVVASGVFHHEGWAPGAIYLDEESMAFFVEFHGAVSPDGPDAFPALATKLDRMHEEEPTLTTADLAGYPGPSLVMVGDDEDEIPIEHTLAFRAGLLRSQLAVVPGTGHGLLMEKRRRTSGWAIIAEVWTGAVRPTTPRCTPPTHVRQPRCRVRAGCRQPRSLVAAAP